MSKKTLNKVLALLESSVSYRDGNIQVEDESKARKLVHKWAETSALAAGEAQAWARYLTRLLALELGCPPASIQDLYVARGRGEVPPTFTVPAMNLRALTFEAASAVFRAAHKINAGAFVFEIARSEIGYTGQRPAEYATSVLAAAIAEGHQAPVFIQGDHFQVSASRYSEDADAELEAVRTLTAEAIQAGFYNIDIDTSTLVDLSQSGEAAQQKNNSELSAMLTAFIRSMEPEGVTVSVGGEIGEVGGRNSTEPELRAYVEGYREALAARGNDLAGLSKISIQTGTSHGGTVLPDGSVADVAVDFETLKHLSRVARDEYGTAGAVQHGASTLPEPAFGKFPEAEACEVHLATNFQNMLYDRLPDALRDEVYAYLDQERAGARKDGETDEQFYYNNRKYALGPFKARIWGMDAAAKQKVADAWQAQFAQLFDLLAIADTAKYIEQTVEAALVSPERAFYFGEEAAGEEDVSDLSD
jgi:hypothetical protein